MRYPITNQATQPPAPNAPPRKFRPAEGFRDLDGEDVDAVRQSASEAGELRGLIVAVCSALDRAVDLRAEAADDFVSVWNRERATRQEMLVQQGLVNRLAGDVLVQKIAKRNIAQIGEEYAERATSIATAIVQSMEALVSKLEAAEYKARLPHALQGERDLATILNDSRALEHFRSLPILQLENMYEGALHTKDERTQRLIEECEPRLREFTSGAGSAKRARTNVVNAAEVDKEIAAAIKLLYRFRETQIARFPEELRVARRLCDDLHHLFRRICGIDARAGGPMSSADFERMYLQAGATPAALAIDPSWTTRLIFPEGSQPRVKVPGWSPIRSKNQHGPQREPATTFVIPKGGAW